LFSICFEKELLSKVITGKISDSEWRTRVKEKLAISIGETLADELVYSWINSEAHIDNRVIEIYKQYLPEAKIVLTTNATSRLNQDLKNQGIDNKFDEIFNSSELGVAKPSHSFFNKVVSRLGVRIEDVIYIDDSIRNVESAGQLGIRSHQYKNYAQLEEFILDSQRVLS
jgi:putative hydrolase of the HAD superfamily